MAEMESVELRMSAAGDCPRLLDYKLQQGRAETNLQSAMRLLTGEPIHAFYRDTLTDAFPGDYCMAEAELKLDIGLGPEIVGHCDGFIRSIGAAVEIKTVGQSTYTMVKGRGEPLQSHREQANLYAGCIENCSQVLFIYHNRDSGEYLTYLVPFSPDLFMFNKTKFRLARERQAAKQMFPRPFNDPTESPCFFCAFKDDCYRGFDSQVAGGDTRVADGVLKSLATSFLDSRAARLAMEKAEEKVKGSLIDMMIREKVTKLIHDRAALEARVGKTGKPSVAIKETK